MHVPGTGLVGFATLYPGVTTGTTTALDTHRAIAISRLPGFDPAQIATAISGIALRMRNATRVRPYVQHLEPSAEEHGCDTNLWAGDFGNLFNNYTWSVSAFQDRLYIGTIDWFFRATSGNESTSIPAIIKSFAPAFHGAELWTFSNASTLAAPVSTSGRGNYTSYGIRNMVNDNVNMWVRMANPMNLRTGPSNYPRGWKLINFPTQNGAPIIAWYDPSDIVYGTPLNIIQLNATANEEGSFSYNPP